jgi:AraC family transcriptional regulator
MVDSGSPAESMALLASSQLNPFLGMVVSRDSSVHETLAQKLSLVATQFVEAACRARDGDQEATQAHIAHAIAVLSGTPSLGPRRAHPSSNAEAHVERGGLPPWKARKIISHVDANLSRRICVWELAELIGLSAGYFCRAFKCVFGASPRDYVLRRRIEVAQAMMLTTSEPLHFIAVSCGMCDQQHFTRSFRRIVGETPSRWRRIRLDSLASTQPGWSMANSMIVSAPKSRS